MAQGVTIDDLVRAVIAAESSGRANVRGKKGELGLMQIRPLMGKLRGATREDLMDPKKNRAVGTELLTEALKRYHGDVRKALEDYNAGYKKVKAGKVPAATDRYVDSILARGIPTHIDPPPRSRAGIPTHIEPAGTPSASPTPAPAGARPMSSMMNSAPPSRVPLMRMEGMPALNIPRRDLGTKRDTLSVPLFNREGPEFADRAYKHNAPFATGGPYQTKLAPNDEASFRQWAASNRVPFNPDDAKSDYDMRGYWNAMRAGKAEPWKGEGSHFPDTFKTPYDTTFSGESKYAKPGTPFSWQGDNLIDTRTGEPIFSPPANAPTAAAQKVFNVIDNQDTPMAIATRPPADLDWAKRRKAMQGMKVYHDPEVPPGIGERIMGALGPAEASAAETSNVKEIPSVMMRDLSGRLVPIPKGATVGDSGAGGPGMMRDLSGKLVPIPKGATVGEPKPLPGAGIAGAFGGALGAEMGRDPRAVTTLTGALPIAGQILGDIGGGMAGAALGGPAGAYAGAVAGSGVGSGIGEEIDIGARKLYGMPTRSQTDVLKDSGIASGLTAVGVPLAKGAEKVLAPLRKFALSGTTSYRAGKAAKEAFLDSREAMRGVMTKMRDVLGIDATTAGKIATEPNERMATIKALRAPVGQAQDQVSNLYRDAIGRYKLAQTPHNYAGRTFRKFEQQYPMESFALRDHVDFKNPTVANAHAFRANVRGMMRKVQKIYAASGQPRDKRMLFELEKLERHATKDIAEVLPADKLDLLQRADRMQAHVHTMLPADEAKAILESKGSAEAIANVLRQERASKGSMDFMMRQIDSMPAARRTQVLEQFKRAMGTWLHEEATKEPTALGRLNAYKKAVDGVPDNVFNRFYGAGAKGEVREMIDATVRFHNRLLAEPNLASAINNAMRTAPMPWFIRHSHWIKAAGLGAMVLGTVHGSRIAEVLLLGFGAPLLATHFNSPEFRKLYLKMLTGEKTPVQIADGMRALLTALAAQEMRSPIEKSDEELK